MNEKMTQVLISEIVRLEKDHMYNYCVYKRGNDYFVATGIRPLIYSQLQPVNIVDETQIKEMKKGDFINTVAVMFNDPTKQGGYFF